MIVYTDKHRIPFQIDRADYEVVRRYTWLISVHGYPCTTIGKWPTARPLRLHLFLLGYAPAGLEWDHRNRDRLDNRRKNLRAVTHSINLHNTGLWISNTSGVKGVYWDKRRGRWAARIWIGGRVRSLGRFATKQEAVRVRHKAEREIHKGAI